MELFAYLFNEVLLFTDEHLILSESEYN